MKSYYRGMLGQQSIHAEECVTGYNGKLNIRPKYQREFIYDDKKRNGSTTSKQFADL